MEPTLHLIVDFGWVVQPEHVDLVARRYVLMRTWKAMRVFSGKTLTGPDFLAAASKA